MMRLIIIFFCVLYSVGSDPAKATDFKEAIDAYQAKKYEKSKGILEKIIKSKGSNVPVRFKLLLGANYFYLRDVQRSQKVFAKLKDEVPDAQTAFAWGVSFYKKKNFRLAVKGFKKVSRENPIEYAYSNYYLGAIHLKVDNAPAAKQFLNRCDPAFLTTGLRNNRRRLLKRANRLISRPFQGLDGAFQSDSVAMSLLGKKSLGKESQKISNSNKEGFVATVSPVLLLNQNTIDSSNHGSAKSTLNYSQNRAHLLVKLGQRQSARFNYNLDMGLGMVQYDVKENSEFLFNIAGTEGDFLDQASSLESSNDFLAFTALGGEYEYNSSISLAVELAAQHMMPDFKQKESLGFVGGEASVSYVSGDIELEAMPAVNYVMNNLEGISAIEISNRLYLNWSQPAYLIHSYINTKYTNKPYLSSKPFRFQSLKSKVNVPDGSWQSVRAGFKSDVPFLGGGVFLGADIWEKSYSQGFAPKRIYNSESLEKAASTVVSFTLGYRYNVFSGISAQVDGRYALLSDYTASTEADIAAIQDEVDRLSADVTTFGGSIGLVVNPYDWFFLTTQYGYYINDYAALSDDSRVEELQGYNPDSNIEIKLILGLEKSF